MATKNQIKKAKKIFVHCKDGWTKEEIEEDVERIKNEIVEKDLIKYIVVKKNLDSMLEFLLDYGYIEVE